MEIDLYFQITIKDFVIFQLIRNYYILWWPYWMLDWNEIRNIFLEPSIDHSCKVSFLTDQWFSKIKVCLAKFQPIRNCCHLTAILDVKSKWNGEYIFEDYTYIIHARCQFKWSSGFLGKEIRYRKLLCPVATILILDVGSEQNKMNCEH